MRPRKAVLLFCDTAGLAADMRMVLELRLPVKVHIEPDVLQARQLVLTLAESDDRIRLVLFATNSNYDSSRLMTFCHWLGTPFLRVVQSEGKAELLRRVRLALQEKRGPKPARKVCAA